MLRLKKMCLFCKIKGNRLESELFSIGYSMRYKQRFININMERKFFSLEKNVVWLWLSLCLFLLASCAEEKEYDKLAGDDYLQLYFTKSETRADLAPDGSGNFSEGDRIGLYINGENGLTYRELTFTGGEWMPRLRRSDFGAGRLQLSAHYPCIPSAAEGNAESVPLSIELNQQENGYTASDLLYSQSALETGEYTSVMTFRHVMHRLRVEFSDAAGDLSVRVRSKVGGTVNLLTGNTQLGERDFQWITPKKNTDGSLEALIFPQSALPYRESEGLMEITVDGKKAIYKVPELQNDGSPLEFFMAGKETTVRLSVQASDSEWKNKKCWTYGTYAADESAWLKLFPEYSNLYLPWKKEYGWYDCNKRNPTANPNLTPDGMMCWAATAANLMHWWIAQNKKYVDLYGERYKGPVYDYPLDKPQESDIFQCYVDAFDDKAGKIDDGINWFIHGKVPSYPKLLAPYNYAGYFKDVFPEGVLLGKNIGGLSKENFNETIKDALQNKKGIGIVIGPANKSHAVTMWGAEFDENGDVSYIYMADNNDRDYFEQWKVGCLRLQIVYETYPEGGSYTCFKSGYIEDNRSTVISRIVTLDLGEEYWKKYLGL